MEPRKPGLSWEEASLLPLLDQVGEFPQGQVDPYEPLEELSGRMLRGGGRGDVTQQKGVHHVHKKKVSHISREQQGEVHGRGIAKQLTKALTKKQGLNDRS